MDEIIYDKLSSLSEISKAQLEKILKTVPGCKHLIIEPSLIKPLERICGVSWLKSYGIEKIFKLYATITKDTQSTSLYMIYTNTSTFESVLQQIQSKVNSNQAEDSKYHIICVPKVLYFFEDIVEQNGLFNNVKLYSFQWFPIHLDQGILSLEMPSMFENIFIQDDYSLLPVFSKSLWHLFLSLGRPNFCLSLGKNANNIVKQLEESTSFGDSDIGGLIVIDRDMDYPGALLTPATYSAMLNEVFGVNSGVCKNETVNDSLLDEQCNKIIVKQAVNFVLDSKKDSVYKLIKDKHFFEVTEILRHLTKDLKVQGETSDMALHEMKRYVQTKLQSVAQKKQFVACHLNAAETLVHLLHSRLQKLFEVECDILQNQSKSRSLTTLEEYLQTERDATSAFALFLLLCTTQKCSHSEVKSFLTKFFIEFGYNHAHLYQKLVKTNIIDSSSGNKLKLQLMSKSTFFSNANKLKQLNAEPDKVSLKNPTCCSYVYGGLYIPLIAQIASLVLSGTPIEDLKQKLLHFGELAVSGKYFNAKKSLMVYIIGGITYSEIAALNLLESMMGVKIIKVSDRIISKNDIANAFIQ